MPVTSILTFLDHGASDIVAPDAAIVTLHSKNKHIDLVKLLIAVVDTVLSFI